MIRQFRHISKTALFYENLGIIPQKNPVIGIDRASKKTFIKTLTAANCILFFIWPDYKYIKATSCILWLVISNFR